MSNKILIAGFFMLSGFFISKITMGQDFNPLSDMKFVESSVETKSHFHERGYIFKDEESAFIKYNPFSLGLGGMLYIYQNAISQQFSASCLFHPSCSQFSKNAISDFGLFKGVFLSADRLTRCNKISGLDIHPLTVNPHTNRSNDPTELYK